METAAAMEAAGDGAWHERAQQLARDLELLREDSRALRVALVGAAADLAFQEECQAAMVDKLAEVRLRRLHEFLRSPDGAKTLFTEAAKPSARRANPTMPRRELRALLAARWEALATDERDDWEARFREYTGGQESEQSAAGRKRPAPKLVVKTAAPSKRKGSADEPAAATPKKRKAVATPSSPSPSPSPSTPSKKRAKASKATAASDSSKAEDLASIASDPGTPSSVSKGGRGSKPSPRKKAAAAKPKTSPAVKSSKAAPTSKARSPAAKAPAATKKTKKVPTAAKKAPKKKAQDSVDDGGDGQKKRVTTRDYSASDEDDDDDDDDDDENESLSGGSPSEDDSDDNMAQLPTGAFG